MNPRTLPPKALSILMLLLLLSSTAVVAVGSLPIGAPDPTVLDPALVEVLATAPDDLELTIIVQYWDDVGPADERLVRELGMDHVGTYRIIPALVARASPAEVVRLSGSPRVRWIEHDVPVEYYMDMTTAVVNATGAWRSEIEGSLWGDAGITGKGVTAVVLDTGIDAGHPDLDYGTKTIRNLKSDTGVGPWYEVENGDTSSGHGTHCAGTVAGNGDASAGQKAGVAPGANLIGLSTGEAGAITGAVGGLQWVYEHSKPGNNPYNIRVVSNSWGAGGGIYEPGDAISEGINRLVYENNVVCVFAAGNSGGDGDTIQSGNYANTPAAICVAAAGRDGSYITDFSSKGRWDWLDTYPDVAAPGHHIDSTAARRTQISAMTQQGDSNPYYLSISGTSMATPHVSGLVALLWQAAPSMKVSEVRQDAGVVHVDGDAYTVVPPEEMSTDEERYNEDYALWNERPDTRIHEAELIIKLTADMIPPQGAGSPDANGLTENAVPDWSVPGYAGERDHDWSQGYGLINVARAVGLALTLERIRWDYPHATVLDAYTVFEDIFAEKRLTSETDRIKASWSGEWARFNQQGLNPLNIIFEANQTKYVYIPEGAEQVTVSMSWSPVDATELIAGTLRFNIDFDDSGSWDYQSGITLELDGTRTETVQVSGTDGTAWRFGVEGHGIKWHRIISRKQFQEARIEYEMAVSITFSEGFGTIEVPPIDPHAIYADLDFAPPSEGYSVGNISLTKGVYDINRIQWQPGVKPPVVPEEEGGPWLWWILLVIVALVVAAYLVARLYPESTPGRLVRRGAQVTGAASVLGEVKRLTRRTYTSVRAGPSGGWGFTKGGRPPNRVIGGIFILFSSITGFVMAAIIAAGAGVVAAMDPTGAAGSILMACVGILVVFSLLALLGALNALTGKNWLLAIVGSVFAILTLGPYFLGSVFGLLGLVLVVISRHEFAGQAPPATAPQEDVALKAGVADTVEPAKAKAPSEGGP